MFLWLNTEIISFYLLVNLLGILVRWLLRLVCVKQKTTGSQYDLLTQLTNIRLSFLVKVEPAWPPKPDPETFSATVRAQCCHMNLYKHSSGDLC